MASRKFLGAAAFMLAAALPAVAVAPAHAQAPSTCGGQLSDYISNGLMAASFAGTVNRNGVEKPMTLTQALLHGSAVRAEINNGPSDYKSVTSNLGVEGDSGGRGTVYFWTGWGLAKSTNVKCTLGTRVTSIIGILEDKGATFQLSRI
ncbi:hypothetical protein ACIQWR_40960 [Streptomyces sp. NPDC098789]|uniref:hypothetical protein n=1 Tax=Streptomyces sp. NPDC098789 TaxID=3366098 RepID=UPI0037FC7B16